MDAGKYRVFSLRVLEFAKIHMDLLSIQYDAPKFLRVTEELCRQMPRSRIPYANSIRDEARRVVDFDRDEAHVVCLQRIRNMETEKSIPQERIDAVLGLALSCVSLNPQVVPLLPIGTPDADAAHVRAETRVLETHTPALMYA